MQDLDPLLQRKIKDTFDRISNLEEKIKQETARFGPDKWEGEEEDFYGLSELAEESINAMVAVSPNAEVLQSALNLIGWYLHFSEEDFRIRPNEDQDGQRLYREPGKMISFLLERLPFNIEEASKKGIVDEYIQGLKTSMRLIEESASKRNFLGIPTMAINVLTDYVEGYGFSIPYSLKHLKERGYQRHLPDIREMLENSGEIWILSLLEHLEDLPNNLDKCYADGLDKEIAATFSLAKKVKYRSDTVGALFHNISIANAYFRKLGRPELYTELCSKLERVAPKNPNFVDRCVRGEVVQALMDYKNAKLEDRFMEVFEFAVSEHENDVLPKAEDVDTHEIAPAALQFFYQFPFIHKFVGEKAFSYYEKAKASATTSRQRSNVMQYLPKVMNASIAQADSWLEFITNTQYEDPEIFDEMVESTALAIQKGTDIISFVPYAYVISKFRLHDRLGSVKRVIDANVDWKTKADTLEDYGILRTLPIEPTADSTWLEKAAEYLRLSPDNLSFLLENCKQLRRADALLPKTRQFGDSDRIAYSEYFIDHLDYIRNAGVDYFKALFHIPVLQNYGFLERGWLESLRNIINSDEPPEKVTDFIKRAYEERTLLRIHAPKNCDFEQWYGEALKAKNVFVRKAAYKYEEDYAVNVLGSLPGKGAVVLLEQIMQLEQQGSHNKALFTIGKVYDRAPLKGLRRVMDFAEATKYLVYGLISRESRLVQQAESVFSREYISQARSLVAKSHIPPTLLYRQIQNDIRILELENCPSEERKVAANNIIGAIYFNYLQPQKEVVGRTQLRHVVRQIRALEDAGDEFFTGLASKMQDWNLYDLADGRRLHCCTLISKDQEYKERSAILYHADPHIGIMHLRPTAEDRYLDPIGATFLVNCTDREGNLVLGVDSFEGGILLDAAGEENWLNTTARAIAGAAEDTNSRYIFINANVGGERAKKFVRKLASKYDLRGTNQVELAKLRGDGVLKIPTPYRYLETWKDKNELSGKATGFLIPAELFVQMVGYEK